MRELSELSAGEQGHPQPLSAVSPGIALGGAAGDCRAEGQTVLLSQLEMFETDLRRAISRLCGALENGMT